MPLGVIAAPDGYKPVEQRELGLQGSGVSLPFEAMENADTVSSTWFATYRNFPFGVIAGSSGKLPVLQLVLLQASGVSAPLEPITNGETVFEP